MSLLSILDNIFLGPLKLVFEIIFSIAHRFIGNPGLAIIVLSLIMNILVLPLYRRADAMQEEARDIDAKLSKGVTHIKKTFTGDERMMILQTYYRQNNYSPLSSLTGSVSLLLEIPFFMAAYQFLSHLDILDGVTLGPIVDLGAPDGLIVIGGIAINLLPILMTLINVISSAIYLKGFPLKTKIQLYAMALFFLIFLYNSPACLVFYWTLNNVFSLVKNIFYKIKNPRKVLRLLCGALGVLVLGFAVFVYNPISFRRKLFLIGIGLVLLIPMILPKIPLPPISIGKDMPNGKQFLLASAVLTILVGVLIPSAYLASSPQDFIYINHFHHPLWYVVSSATLAIGTFMVWLRVFYWLASDNGKVIFEKLIWIMCGIMVVNYMFFGTDLGVIYSNLQFEHNPVFGLGETAINLFVILALSVILLLISVKWSKTITTVLLTAVIALSAMSALNVVTIQSSTKQYQELHKNSDANFQLSTTGQNVVVIMLDRAIGAYTPYIFDEKPELVEKFDGFTYYSNTMSYATVTNIAAPALMGGYEYTPVELNKRDKELLVDKHNEAISVLPVLFSQNNYDVTVLDPPYANYQEIPDLGLYDQYPGVDAYITNGRFNDISDILTLINNNHRNFFCLSLMETMPIVLQPTIYNHGRYNQATRPETNTYSQVINGTSTAEGINGMFMSSYNVLINMENIGSVTDDKINTFLLMTNDITHEPMLLQKPDYVPQTSVDNTPYDTQLTDQYVHDGIHLKMNDTHQITHYHVNMSAMLRLAEWFDYLRENNVYDNTRIILVSDHGRGVGQIDQLIMRPYDIENFYPLLMVKDFNAHGFTTSDEFMTNADVPVLATDNVIAHPVNPFTGKELTNSEKFAHKQYISASGAYKVSENNGYTFIPSAWLSVEKNIWDQNNWSIHSEVTTLKDHAAP